MTRSEVLPGLYVSGFPTSEDVADVDAVVNLVGSIPFVRRWLEYIMWPIEDSDHLPDEMQLRAVARHVACLVRRGRKVLVHCGAGVNRANLVACRALMYLGFPFQDADRMLQERRLPDVLKMNANDPEALQYWQTHGVLVNPTFRKWLENERIAFPR